MLGRIITARENAEPAGPFFMKIAFGYEILMFAMGAVRPVVGGFAFD
jgi:hypothetical protein